MAFEVYTYRLLITSKAAKTPGKKCKSLPLHIASRNGCSTEILKMLFEAYPEALDKKNVTGQTPYESGEGHGTSQRSLDAMTQGIQTHWPYGPFLVHK